MKIIVTIIPTDLLTDSLPYPGVSLGTPVLCKGSICLYKWYFVIHLNRLEY